MAEDAVCNFVNNTVEESKYCSEVMQRHFNKELVITKKDDEDFKNSNKCWIFEKDYFKGDVIVRDYCHVTGSIEVLQILITVKLNRNSCQF